jgi:hypothetical protein
VQRTGLEPQNAERVAGLPGAGAMGPEFAHACRGAIEPDGIE